MTEYVVLVNEQGDAIGTMEKLEAHEKGLLHLAFSVLLYRETDLGKEFLLQKRAECKYHSKNKWSNTCCSHPRVNENVEAAGTRRLNEEIGITGVLPEQFVNLGWFIYQAELENGLSEHEQDYILIANTPDVSFILNPEEVSDIQWWSEADIEKEMKANPDTFSVWFPTVYKKVLTHLQQVN
ncbi:isopentenyl-diphosphate Delta-isomerase [Aliivibrio fischeri]|uniref:isopentenyl-diphosphate Delta-isomerase n=1 Tax=Aliivibrio fischeri TaxID=668 RepID=UPI0007C5A0F9|nr:isopentenyl-diphosphate Delta-isomerase [Aliivibrio fischeri]MCE7537370.1 isopentenyl-diphosphate Delta-isomerase [Aliivibrio fischeri]MCE7560328.1 isopentenyl-diphosphate Delta-isomerase [Aliivibrio fischeri]MUK43260.1 isopentenyl-diphosphate Delta-isomerase [Aliivibrio fischeri]TGA71361.1 isopentenyl-diphosphate Delta-isomerase [Aliivibrio fischeri]